MRVFPPRNLLLFPLILIALAAPLHAGARLRGVTPFAPPPGGFTATATPNPLTLAGAGDQKQVVVSTEVDAAFQDPQITYSFAGLPNFITNNGPMTTTISGGYNPVTFTFTLGAGFVPGTYNGTLFGQSSVANAPKAFPFTVIVLQPDIIASFTNPAITLCNGGPSLDDLIQLTPSNGYSGAPKINFTSVPAGITINPVSTTAPKLPPSQTVPFVIAANGAATGSQFVTANISDSAANISKNITLQVTVVDPDFTPNVTPSNVTITAGGAPSSINVSHTPNSCFKAAVSVAASGMPAGMTITPSPAASPASMTIQATSSTNPGTYPITLTYTSGNIVKTLTIQVTVNAAPDFILNIDPSSLTAQPGGSVTAVASITPVNNFNGTVTVTSPSTPDVLITPQSFTLTAGATRTITFSVAPTATPGLRPLQFIGSAPTVIGQRVAPVNLTITEPPSFTLIATPAVLTVPAGGSGVATISATALNGFTGVVTVNAPQNVPGVTITPQTFTIDAGGPGQKVTIATGAIAPQTIPLTFTGTAPNVNGVKTATVELVIVAAPDYRITVTPDVLSIVDGGTTTVQVGVTALNGFNGAVAIDAPKFPGVTFMPANFTLTPGATQTVEVTVTPGTDAGVRTGEFIGNAAPGQRSAPFTLTITRRPDFTIAAAPPALIIRAGGNGVVTITATAVNGFTGLITVTAPTMPNLTFTPSTFTILPGASQQVTIHANQPAQPRLAIFTATAPGVPSPHEASVLVTVLPPAPVLTAAVPGAVVVGANNVVIRVSGELLQPGAVFHSSDASMTVVDGKVLTPQLADVTLTVRNDATPGPRNLTVTNPDGGTSVTPLVLLVYPPSSIAAPLDVTAAAIVFPPRGTMIAPKEALYPRGLLATTGTGTILGTWQFDGVPFDRFVANAAGGMPVEVRSNMPIPTSFTGSHTLELVIDAPRHVVSPVIEVVDAIDRVSRLTLLAPRDGAVINGREQLFRWSLVPNCTGFDVEVALPAETNVPDALTPMRTFRVNDAQWKPNSEQLAEIGPGIHRWRVRPHCAGDVELEASEWQRFAILPEHVDITLLPMSGRTIRWQSGVTGLLYRVEFLDASGNVTLSALTSRTEFVAPAGQTTVRVSAIGPNGAILGTSASSPISRGRRSDFHLVQQLTVVEFGPVQPADGATVQNPQPRITAEWKGAVKPDQIILLVDNTDITAVATVTPTSIAYDSLIALAPGPHSVALSVAGNINRWTFNVEMPGSEAMAATAAAAPRRGDWVIAPVGTVTLVRNATNEAHTQISALTDLNLQTGSVTNKATGDLGLKHDFDQDKTIQESRNWLTDVGARQGTKTSESIRFGFAAPDFFDQAQLVTSGLPRGGVQAKVVMPGGTASYYQTFTSRPAGLVTGFFGPEQRLKAASFQIPFNLRWDFRVLGLKVDESPSFNSSGGEGTAFGVFARFSIGSTLNAIFEGARGDFKPALGSFEERQKGNAYRIGLSGIRGSFNYALNIRRTESEFINPANRGFTPGGVPDRTAADLTVGRFFGTTSITVQLRHQQDGSASGLLVPRTKQTGGLVSLVKMLGSHVSLALSGNITKDSGEEKPEIFLPRADRSQSGGTGTLSEFFGKFNFSQTLSHQLLRDHIFNLNDQTITSGTVTGGGMLSQYVNLAAVLSGTRSKGSFIVGTTDQWLASLQPTFSLPKIYVSLQPRASYSTSKNDLYESKTTTEQYQGLVTFAPLWLGSIVALQLSADWTKNSFAGQIGPAKFVHRYVGTLNFHWRAGIGPAYTNYVPFAAPGTATTPANPATATPGSTTPAGFPH